jgi:glycosyltransferase involved in cell wall biosynthesis
VVSKYFSPREYGFETRSFAMARHWAKSGRDVVMIASDSNHFAKFPALQAAQVEETIAGIRCVWLRVMKYTRTASLRRVLTWLHFEWRLFRLDDSRLPRPGVVVVSSLSLFTILNGLRLRRTHRCKLVFEIRDIWPLTLVEEGGFSRWHPLSLVMAWVERLGYRRSDLVIGTMPNLGPHASRIAGRPVRCECIPFGFEPAEVAAAEANPLAVRRIERLPGQLIVGYAGSMGETNALDTIVACMVRLRDDSRFRFVMVGDGDLRARFQAQAADCPNVEWIGRVPRGEVRAWLEQCDLLYFAVHDSKVWESGMSLNKLTDYLLAARPVIASYSGFPSILDESGCGEYLPSRDQKALLDALERYAAMPADERERMGAAGRRWLFEHRTWAILAAEYLALLDNLILEGSARGTPARSKIQRIGA